MKYKIKKELQNRIKYRKFEKRILVLKYIFKNLLRGSHGRRLGKKIRYIISTKIFFPSISKVELVRRCVLTGRSRVSHRLLNVSRIKLKEILRQGIVPGASKYSW